MRVRSSFVIAVAFLTILGGSLSAQKPLIVPSPAASEGEAAKNNEAANRPQADRGAQAANRGQADRGAQADQIIQLLESGRFADRVSAMRQLRGMGIDGHPVLEEIVQRGDSDSALAAFDMLKTAAGSSDGTLSTSATEGLKRIAQGKGQLSELAGDYLDGPRPPRTVNPPMAPQLRQRGFGGPVRRQTRISIKTVNGIRSIEVVENNQRFQFKDVADGLETQRPGAGGAIVKRVYKDAEELKKADLEAYKAYEKAGGPKRSRLATPFPFQFGFPQPGNRMPPRMGVPRGIPNFPGKESEQPRRVIPPQKAPAKPASNADLIEV